MRIGAAYLRCSDPRQDKSIEQQREEIARRAEQDGVAIPPENWFIDEGLTGRSARKRDAYQALLRRAEDLGNSRRGRRRRDVPRVDVLFVWATSRLARNMMDCFKLLAALDEAGIEVVSLTEPEAVDKSIQGLLRMVYAWLAERYSEELGVNVRRGMRSQAERGYWVFGRPPFGYELARGEKASGSHLVVTEETRPDFLVVQWLFSEYLEGEDGDKRIAQRLTREGARPPARQGSNEQGVKPWRTKQIRQILTNQTYCGHLVYKGEVVARDVHEAAIDDETFERVQARRRLRAEARRAGQGNGASKMPVSQRGLLTPWLRCGHCGSRIHVARGGRPGKRTYLYYCAARTDNVAACDGISVRTGRLDRIVLDALETSVLTPDNLRVLAEDAIERLGADATDLVAEERSRLTQELAELDERIQSTAGLVLDGMLDGDDARAMNAPLIQRRDHARLRLASLPGQIDVPRPEDIDPEPFREAVLQAWEARPVVERRRALDTLLEQVTLSEGGVHIAYRAKVPSWGYHGHAPYGPPYAPMSLSVPSGSPNRGSGSPESMQGDPGSRWYSSSKGSLLAV